MSWLIWKSNEICMNKLYTGITFNNIHSPTIHLYNKQECSTGKCSNILIKKIMKCIFSASTLMVFYYSTLSLDNKISFGVSIHKSLYINLYQKDHINENILDCCLIFV